MGAKTYLEEGYDRQTAKFAATFLTCMPRMSRDVMQGWIENPQGLKTVLEGALVPPGFPIWKTITLGVYKTGDEYRNAMKSQNYKITYSAGDILRKITFTCATKVSDVDLVMMSVASLGFKKGAKYKDICVRALHLGLELCPSEVGPALRLAYKDQPRGDEWFIFAMNSITDSKDDPYLFYMLHDDVGPWLAGDYGRSKDFWNSDTKFIFVKPRK